MNTVTLLQTPHLVIGSGCRAQCRAYLLEHNLRRCYVLAPACNLAHAHAMLEGFDAVEVDTSLTAEPTVNDFKTILERAQRFQPDVVIGLGGGSALDIAKLVAVLLDGAQQIESIFGIGLIQHRTTHLVCLPTTSGTGSEVSPNAILLDESDQLKKGVVSPHLVPDAAFVDAELTLSVPPAVTAATGLDALTHCIEAYTNRFAHPVVDVWALEGVRLIASALEEAVKNPSSVAEREKLALGSLYGGLCLGPVNTAAVHALSYPLGGVHHIPHGHANAILLPHVMRFNLQAAPDRFAAVALALGAVSAESSAATAEAGIAQLWKLIDATGLEMRLGALGVDPSEAAQLAAAGLSVTRLMKNNPRSMTQQEAEQIYHAAFAGHTR
jgi:alcohol dehydrogenase class IV